jgi:TolB protein
MNADGSNKTRLREGGHPVRDLTWSPDGAQIAFAEYAYPFGEEIYVMNAIGSGLTRLTSNEAQDLHPAWSPDGAKIAFTSHRDGEDYGSIYVMDADSNNQSRPTAGACCPTWSPDGTRIAFVHQPPNGEVAVIYLDDGHLSVLTDNDYQ